MELGGFLVVGGLGSFDLVRHWWAFGFWHFGVDFVDLIGVLCFWGDLKIGAFFQKKIYGFRFLEGVWLRIDRGVRQFVGFILGVQWKKVGSLVEVFGESGVRMVTAGIFHCKKHSWPPEEYVSRATLQLVSLFSIGDCDWGCLFVFSFFCFCHPII